MYDNNPGYSVAMFKTDDKSKILIEDVTINSFQLSSYVLYKSERFYKYNITDALGGADLNSAVEIRDYYETMMTSP